MGVSAEVPNTSFANISPSAIPRISNAVGVDEYLRTQAEQHAKLQKAVDDRLKELGEISGVIATGDLLSRGFGGQAITERDILN